VRNINELQRFIKENIVKYIQGQRIKWWEHLNRMEDIKPGTVWNPVEVRTEGRPKNR
jgi:hypothetical protein